MLGLGLRWEWGWGWGCRWGWERLVLGLGLSGELCDLISCRLSVLTWSAGQQRVRPCRHPNSFTPKLNQFRPQAYINPTATANPDTDANPNLNPSHNLLRGPILSIGSLNAHRLNKRVQLHLPWRAILRRRTRVRVRSRGRSRVRARARSQVISLHWG